MTSSPSVYFVEFIYSHPDDIKSPSMKIFDSLEKLLLNQTSSIHFMIYKSLNIFLTSKAWKLPDEIDLVCSVT